MLADVAVSRLPLYAKHFYLPFLYTLVYSIFNGAYVGAGGKDSVRWDGVVRLVGTSLRCMTRQPIIFDTTTTPTPFMAHHHSTGRTTSTRC